MPVVPTPLTVGTRPHLDWVEEQIVVFAAIQALTAGVPTHVAVVPRGRLSFRGRGRILRVAVYGSDGERLAIASLRGVGAQMQNLPGVRLLALLLTLGGRLQACPPPGSGCVSELMNATRSTVAAAPDPRGIVTRHLADAVLFIQPSGRSMQASGPLGTVRLQLDDMWDGRNAARIAEMVMRTVDKATAHLTRTTEPRGTHWHPRPGETHLAGGGFQGHGYKDYSSIALCSCGWSHYADDRQGAQGAAFFHRDNPSAVTWTAW